MTHSIAAKYTARPAARFPAPSPRARQVRLGLHGRVTFRAATARPTILREPMPSAFVRLRSGARAMTTTRTPVRGVRPPTTGSLTWAAPAVGRRPSAHPAPWRA